MDQRESVTRQSGIDISYMMCDASNANQGPSSHHWLPVSLVAMLFSFGIEDS